MDFEVYLGYLFRTVLCVLLDHAFISQLLVTRTCLLVCIWYPELTRCAFALVTSAHQEMQSHAGDVSAHILSHLQRLLFDWRMLIIGILKNETTCK